MERPICPIRRDAGAREGLGHLPAMLVAWLLLLPAVVAAEWSAQPGDRVRDAFGPPGGAGATVCRGACGAGCPSTCEQRVAHECVDGERLRRVRIYECGSHLGCREHDDCLDRCLQQHAQGFDCQTQCHGEVVERGDFVGNLLKRGLEFMPAQDGGADRWWRSSSPAVSRSRRPEDVDISMAPLGPDGEPIEAQRVGTGQAGPRPVPNNVDLPGPSGHLVVPMYQTVDSASSEPVMVREVRCSHKGVPVLETTFRLRFDDR